MRMIKKLWKPFLIIFLLSFLVINWNYISPFFNYKLIAGEIDKILSKLKPQIKEEVIIKEGNIEIPKIGVSAPIIFSENEDQIDGDLKKGVVYFPGSALPRKEGMGIILGHSAPPNWPEIDYDGIFSRLEELLQGDDVSIRFSGKDYSYKVIKTIFLEKGEEIPSLLTNSRSMILLISCWPPGKNLRRIGVQLESI